MIRILQEMAPLTMPEMTPEQSERYEKMLRWNEDLRRAADKVPQMMGTKGINLYGSGDKSLFYDETPVRTLGRRSHYAFFLYMGRPPIFNQKTIEMPERSGVVMFDDNSALATVYLSDGELRQGMRIAAHLAQASMALKVATGFNGFYDAILQQERERQLMEISADLQRTGSVPIIYDKLG